MSEADGSPSGPGSPDQALRVAIVGAGPAGFFTAQDLYRSGLNVTIDMFDRQPTPFGLVRTGVAPDHQKIKKVAAAYEKVAATPGFRFFGNVDYGRDVTLADLRERYHQLVFSCGAQGDRTLNIPGEDLQGVHSARQFVAWYNADPDFSDAEFAFDTEGAVVVGVGNVAADVARVLCRTPEELARTDIADHALEALRESRLRSVHVLGRRGPVQSAFSPPEIRELGELEGVETSTRADEMALDEFSREELESGADEIRRKYDALKALEDRSEPDKPRKLSIRFAISPVELLGDDKGRVRAVRAVRNELYRDDSGKVRPRPTDEVETIECGLVFRSVGYYGTPLEDLPYDEHKGVTPNDQGRVINPQTNRPLRGIYVAGWIKRGPSGLIGANKMCARETAECMREDLAENRLLAPQRPDPEATPELLGERGVRFVTYDDWRRIDAFELERGEASGRPRVKVTDRAEFLRVAEGVSAEKG